MNVENITDEQRQELNYVYKSSPEVNSAEIDILNLILEYPDRIDAIAPGIEPYHFSNPMYQKLFKGLKELIEAEPDITFQEIGYRFSVDPNLNKGDFFDILRCKSFSPLEMSSAHCALIKKAYVARGIDALADKIKYIGDDNFVSNEEKINLISEELVKLQNSSKPETSEKIATDAAAEAYAYFEQVNNGEEKDYVPTGYLDLDASLAGGIRGGQLGIIAGRAGMGKTAFALQLATQVAENDKEHKVLFYSKEAKARDLAERQISNISGIEAMRLKKGEIESHEWEEILNSILKIPPNLSFCDDYDISWDKIKSQVRRKIASGHKISCIVVDYLQLFTSSMTNNIVQEIGKITREAKCLAKECNICVLLLSQFSRGLESRNDKRPLLCDLRDSGKIEDDANFVLGLYRDEYYNPESSDKNTCEVLILKNRDGFTGRFKLLTQMSCFRFRNKAKELLQWSE